MEIKILCSCNTKYKFDVEPVNGQMPFAVNCPTCGLNGTEAANASIQQAMSSAAPAEAPRLRIALAGHAESEAPAAESPTPAAAQPAEPPTPPPVRAVPRVATHQPVGESEGVGRMGLGLLGALLGAVVGAAIYYLVFGHWEARFKLLALAVGYLAGLGAQLLCKEASTELGVIAAVLSIAGVMGAQYFVAQQWFHEGMAEISQASSYDARVAEAKKVVEAMPNGTDQEIRLYLAKEEADEGEKPDPNSISTEDVTEFRETVLPALRDLASGKITKEEFEKQERGGAEPVDLKEEKEDAERTFKWLFVALTFGKFNLVCIAGAAALAYKMNAGA